ncbi:hypothetical protein [Streptomyces sp. NPDC048248]|uniref:hypothetical protein n=1 Tax=Streptomyces sp. NPDC048248 TaxID=3365523 RepID=UPI0037127B71
MRSTALTLSTATVTALLVCGAPPAAGATAHPAPAPHRALRLLDPPRIVTVQGELNRLTARCPDGSYVISGGFEISGYEIEQTVTASHPTAAGDGWVVSADSINPELLKQLEVIQAKQDAVDNATTDAQREAAQKELEEAQRIAYNMPQRAPVNGAVHAVCSTGA